jgi:hypothetical protein
MPPCRKVPPLGTRGRENELPCAFRNLGARGFEHAHIDFLPQIDDVALVAPIVLQILHQYRFQRYDFAHKPRPQFRRAHARAKIARWRSVTIHFRRLCHSSPASAFEARLATTSIQTSQQPKGLKSVCIFYCARIVTGKQIREAEGRRRQYGIGIKLLSRQFMATIPLTGCAVEKAGAHTNSGRNELLRSILRSLRSR